MNTTSKDTTVEPVSEASSKRAARFQRAERRQIEWRPLSLEQIVDDDHPVRAVWGFVCDLDLSDLYGRIRAVEGRAGAAPIDPRILFALWMYATIRGISSGRRLAELCSDQGEVPYQWICGGVSVNYHTLNDFRTAHPRCLDRCLTESVGVLMHEGLVSLERVAQDGMRVRANASSQSFRRQPTLEECLHEADEQVKALRDETEDSDRSAGTRRQQAAQKRAVYERQARVRHALEELKKVRAKNEKRKKGSGEQARCSTTDPEARRMKMADGGFRPAYNVQFETTADSRVIVGVAVTNSGSDAGQMTPMLDQVEKRFGKRPKESLVDGGFSTREDITAAEKRGTTVFAPVKEEQKKRKKGIDPFAPVKTDNPEIARWRQRMGTAEAQEIYRERAGIAEFSNAGCRNRGLYQFPVRGLEKVKSVVMWQALVSVFQRGIDLRRKAQVEAN